MNLKNPPSNAEHSVTLYRFIPNLISLSAVAAGLTSTQEAMNGRLDRAIIALLIGLILDGMDGAIARLMKATSDFGAQLDNLSDFLAFGVAPTIILYAWSLTQSGKVAWTVMVFYTAATALRLARFHVEQKTRPGWNTRFFSGIPSPAGAGLVLLPIIFWLQFPDFFKNLFWTSLLVNVWTVAVAALMVSRVPTFSLKNIKMPAKMAMSLMAGVAFLIAALINAPWQTLTVIGLTYIISIPVAIWRFNKLKTTHQNEVDVLAPSDYFEQL